MNEREQKEREKLLKRVGKGRADELLSLIYEATKNGGKGK